MSEANGKSNGDQPKGRHFALDDRVRQVMVQLAAARGATPETVWTILGGQVQAGMVFGGASVWDRVEVAQRALFHQGAAGLTMACN